MWFPICLTLNSVLTPSVAHSLSEIFIFKMWVSCCSLTLGQKREMMCIGQPSEMTVLGFSLQPMLWPALFNENYSWRQSVSFLSATEEVWAVNMISRSPYLSLNHKALVSIIIGFPGSSVVKKKKKKSVCQCRRREFDPKVGKIHWRRKWQPTPVFLLGISHGQKSLVDDTT